MNKKIKIKYTNNKKINEMIEEEKKAVKLGFTFAGIAIFCELCNTVNTPDPALSAIVIANVIGIGACASKTLKLENKIKHYIETHKNL